jgi:hypothetical protein
MKNLLVLGIGLLGANVVYAICPQVTAPAQPNCSSGCTHTVNNGGDLHVNNGNIYCVPAGDEKTVSNVILNGGALRVCGKLTVNEMNANGNNAKTVDVSSVGKIFVNNSLNISGTAFTNHGLVHVKGDRIQLNSSGNRFINTETATLFMDKNGGELIVNDPNSSTNDFYNYGKSFLRKVRINGNKSDRVCLDNTSSGYKFCLMEGFHVNPNGSMGIVGNCNPAPGTNIMDVTGVCDFQNPQKLVNGLPAGLTAGDFTAVLYQGSSTLPSDQLPGVGQVLTGGKWGDISATRLNEMIDCQPGAILPINLVKFAVKLQNNGDARLNWTTASELNNDRFEIERSIDGKNFAKIDEVKGAGTTTSKKDYAYDDKDVPDAEYIYYRLKQVDKNGSSTTSSVQVIRNESKVTEVKYANPAPLSAPLNLKFNAKLLQSHRTEVTVSIVDMTGKQVSEKKATVVKGQNELDVAPVLKAGTYVIRVKFSDGSEPIAKKVIFQ